MTTSRWTAWSLALALTASVGAWGQEAERPWARGVAKDKQTRALALFREGNAALKEGIFGDAETRYRAALDSWNHPAIHYNLALALMNLRAPLEAHQQMTMALKYGVAPLDDDKVQQGQRYLQLLEAQLAKLKIVCPVAGAEVTLDGNPLFKGPGEWEGLVRAGNHGVLSSMAGFLPDQRSLTLVGGDASTVTLRVYKTEDLTEYRRAFSPVISWATLGLGLAAIGTGVGLHTAAANGFKSYDSAIGTCVGGASGLGCYPDTATQALKANASGMQTGAVTLYAVGGAALAASAVLFYVGRPVAYQRSVNVEAPRVTVLPLITPSVGGAAASLEF
jgi:hypothetical protein